MKRSINGKWCLLYHSQCHQVFYQLQKIRCLPVHRLIWPKSWYNNRNANYNLSDSVRFEFCPQQICTFPKCMTLIFYYLLSSYFCNLHLGIGGWRYTKVIICLKSCVAFWTYFFNHLVQLPLSWPSLALLL